VKRQLTAASIEKARPPKSGYTEIFDLGYPGLCVRIGHGGAKAFVLFHHVNGKLKRTTLGRWPRVSLADARNAWRRVTEGKAPTEDSASGELMAKVVEDWLKLDAGRRCKPSTLRGLHHIADKDILPVWGNRPIDSIDRKDVAALLDAIIERGSPVKARRVHAAIHRMFKWGVSRGIIKSNPMTGMEMPGKETSRERVLSDVELVKIWKASEPLGPAGAVARMLILTGARREEISQLKWSEIKENAIHLENGRTKNGTAHIIPLSAPALKVLESMPRFQGCDAVFTFDGKKAISGGWSRNKDKLDAASGVTAWTYHDLRRTLATGLERMGVSLQTVEAVLGHTSGSKAGIFGMYQKHKYAGEKRAALEQWGAYIESII
jgi:integrase